METPSNTNKASATIIAKTEMLVNRYKAYQPFKNPTDDQSCNAKNLEDSGLADLAFAIQQYTNTILNFLPKITIQVGDGTTLRKRCCNCPTTGTSVTAKNAARSSVLSQLETWYLAVKDWKNQDYSLAQKKTSNQNSNTPPIRKKIVGKRENVASNGEAAKSKVGIKYIG